MGGRERWISMGLDLLGVGLAALLILGLLVAGSGVARA
jgi:hypothetical protein